MAPVTPSLTCCGRIGRKINVRTVLAGQDVGVRQVSDRIRLVSFMDYDLGTAATRGNSRARTFHRVLQALEVGSIAEMRVVASHREALCWLRPSAD